MHGMVALFRATVVFLSLVGRLCIVFIFFFSFGVTLCIAQKRFNHKGQKKESHGSCAFVERDGNGWYKQVWHGMAWHGKACIPSQITHFELFGIFFSCFNRKKDSKLC